MSAQVLAALYGGTAAVFAVAGLVFLRYWKLQRDRLFAFFGGACACFAAGQVLRIATGVGEHGPELLIPRLVGFLLIIAAIFDKNRRARA